MIRDGFGDVPKMSIELHPRTRPNSCGAQQIELTEESWLLYS